MIETQKPIKKTLDKQNFVKIQYFRDSNTTIKYVYNVH